MNRYSYYNRVYGKESGTSRSVPRGAGDDDSAFAARKAHAWVCAGAAHPGGLRRPAAGGGGFTLPGAAANAQGGLARVGGGNLREGATDTNLPIDGRGIAAPGKGSRPV